VANEEWRVIDLQDSEHSYLVSSLGRVKRAETTIHLRNGLTGRVNARHLPERILAQQTNRTGYRIVSLQLSPRRKWTLAVAPLVCAAFSGPKPSPDMHCAHLNGDRQDNRAENLAWATSGENMAHQTIHGTRIRGESHPLTRVTADDVRRIRRLVAAGPRGIGRKLAAEYGITPTSISDICTRKTWGHV
jgi:hypothetical protein